MVEEPCSHWMPSIIDKATAVLADKACHMRCFFWAVKTARQDSPSSVISRHQPPFPRLLSSVQLNRHLEARQNGCRPLLRHGCASPFGRSTAHGCWTCGTNCISSTSKTWDPSTSASQSVLRYAPAPKANRGVFPFVSPSPISTRQRRRREVVMWKGQPLCHC